MTPSNTKHLREGGMTMGLFDFVRFDYPLPAFENGSERDWHTQSMECQMSNYKILEDGTLLRAGIDDVMYLTCKHTGEIRFYDEDDTFSSYFVDGKLKELHRINWEDA